MFLAICKVPQVLLSVSMLPLVFILYAGMSFIQRWGAKHREDLVDPATSLSCLKVEHSCLSTPVWYSELRMAL